MATRQPDLRALAQRQRWMIWLVALVILSQCLMFWGPLTGYQQVGIILIFGMVLLRLVIYVLMIVGVVLLLHAQGNHILMIVMCGILMVAPCANLLLLMLVNMSVTRTLKRAGIHVGLLGANLDEVERILNPMLCRGCGYDLTGNVSGICPECGRPIDPQPQGVPSGHLPTV